MNLFAVIVTFNPNVSNLLRLVEGCLSFGKVCVVDNGSVDTSFFSLVLNLKGAYVKSLGSNYGIAHAQNVGIAEAKLRSAEYIIFFDQDSNPTTSTFVQLIKAMLLLSETYDNIALVGPAYSDTRHTNQSPFFRIEGFNLIRVPCGNSETPLRVDHLISSGSLISVKTINSVGDMRSELFIDYVDLEWCERALSMGYQAFGVCAARMEHELGDSPIKFLGTAYPARSPLRHYYMFRNAVWMYRQNYVRWNWKVVDGLRLLRKYVFYTLFAKPQHVHFWMMTKGMWHGLIGKMGRYEG